MTNYSTLLKDPRWQKKRLKILERDNWKCKCCNAKHRTLAIHHKKYNGMPWDVEDDYLITLCESCHSLYEALKYLNREILDITRKFFENKMTYLNVFCNSNERGYELMIYTINFEGEIHFNISISLTSLNGHLENFKKIIK